MSKNAAGDSNADGEKKFVVSLFRFNNKINANKHTYCRYCLTQVRKRC